MPGNEWLENHRQAFVQPPTMVMLLRAQGLLEALLNDFGMWFAQSFGCSLSLSLSVEEGRFTCGGVAEILAKF